jgi:hypothetical protein
VYIRLGRTSTIQYRTIIPGTCTCTMNIDIPVKVPPRATSKPSILTKSLALPRPIKSTNNLYCSSNKVRDNLLL